MKLGHYTVEELRDICVMLNLERSGEKRVLADRIAKYIYKPVDLGKSKPAPKRSPQKRKKAKSAGLAAGRRDKTAKAKPKDDEGEEETASDADAEMLADLDGTEEEESTLLKAF